MTQPFLKVRELSHSFNGRSVFSGFKFSITSGQSILLQGENGAGKTTILKIVSGLLEPTAASFVLADQPCATFKQIKNQLRAQSIYLHQQPFLFDTSVENNLDYATNSANGLSDEQRRSIVAELSIENLLEQNAANLSVGQKQRVAIARSLLFNPRLLILDEPFTAVDKDSFNHVVSVLKRYKNQGGTLLLVSHQHDRDFDLIDTCWCIHPKGVLYCVSAD